jgi:hypothetical protein
MAAPPVFYLIPGLGADERVFQFLRLPGTTHVLQWLTPQTPIIRIHGTADQLLPL